jgi:hypothetical protein
LTHASNGVLVEAAKPLGHMVSVQARTDDSAIHETIHAEDGLSEVVREFGVDAALRFDEVLSTTYNERGDKAVETVG